MHKPLAHLQAARERFWVVPAITIVLAIAAGVALPILDRALALPDWLALSGKEETARALLTAIVTVGVSVAGVSFSVLAVALVLASQQLSPRVLRSFQRQPLNQAVLAALLGTATYALFVLAAVSDVGNEQVPELSVTIAMLLAAGSLILFVLFLHHAVRSLNASTVIRRIAVEGHESVAAPFPSLVGRAADDNEPAEHAARRRQEAAWSRDVRVTRAGYIASVDGQRIVRWAAETDSFVEQRRGIGAFAITGAVVAVVHSNELDDLAVVRDAFVLREERVVDADVAFPIRQLSDIALKGLSPSVNDPTTAENAMDSVTDTLVRFAQRDPVAALRADEDGIPRLRALAPELGDLVLLAFDQVRRDAANRPSFAVRLLELLGDLQESAEPARACHEIERQARLIAEQASDLAEHHEDQRMVLDVYERLHAAGASA